MSLLGAYTIEHCQSHSEALSSTDSDLPNSIIVTTILPSILSHLISQVKQSNAGPARNHTSSFNCPVPARAYRERQCCTVAVIRDTTDSLSAEHYCQRNRLTLSTCKPSLCQAEALYVASRCRAWAAGSMHDAKLGYSFVCYRIIIGILMHIPEMS